MDCGELATVCCEFGMRISGKTIDLVIIGTAKAGTTSLASWLGVHPDVCMSQPKETMFFGIPGLFDQGIDYLHSRFFPHYQGESLIGDATPAYSDRDRHPGTPERVWSINPAAKVVYIVRHPLKKVESCWQMHVNLSPNLVNTPEHRLYCLRAREGFRAYVEDVLLFEHFVSVCRYQYQLSSWRERFSDAQIHVMFLEDLASHRDAELLRLCEFLDLDPEPLLGARLTAENTLEQRRKVRWFVPYLRRLRLQKLVPASMKRVAARSALFSTPQSAVYKPIWSEAVLARFVDAVRPDVQQFLVAHGKSESFYSFQV